jgi:TolA-binding protein
MNRKLLIAALALAGAGRAHADDKAFGSPSPAAEQKKIIERKVKATELKKKDGPTAKERAKQEFAGKQRPAVTQFDDPMERNRALIEAKQKAAEERRQQLIERLESIYKRTLGQGGNPTREAELLHRMAEFHWESARHHYFLRRFEYEQRMEEHLAGKGQRPVEPKPDYTKSMEVYRKLLREHPGYARIDEVIFFLGDGLKLVGRDGDAAPYFQKLVKGHPRSKFVPDALLGLAEYFFKSDLLFAARDSYKKIVDQFPQSRVYNYALYKLGWTYYNLGGMDPKNYRAAITTFLQVIGNIDKERTSEKSKIEFRDQAMKDIIIAFAAVSTGTQEAREYFTARGGQKLAVEMLDRLAKFYLATDKDEEAIAVLRWFMELDPNGPKIPEWEETILESLKKIGKAERIEKEMLAIVERLGPKGAWTAANAGNAELVKKARDLAEGSLEYLASHYHQEAQRLREDRHYRKAAQYYKLFVDTFPDSPKAYRARFFLAEITFLKLDRAEEAAGYYADVVKVGPGEFLGDAAYGRIACYNKLMRADRNRTETGRAYKYAQVGGKEKRVYEKRPIPKWEQKFVEASDDYVRLVQKPDEAVPVMYNAAEIFFYNNHYDDAVKRYAYIVEKHPTHKYALYSANNILESYNRLENWKEIELWAKRLRDNPSFKARKKSELDKFIALAIFNQANDLRAKKSHDQAAAELLRLQAELPKAEMSDEALFSAASLYSEGKKHELAIRTFQRLIDTYPRSAKAKQATFLIGAIHEGLADFGQAAVYFERRAAFRGKSDEGRNALYNAGFLRQALGEQEKALDLFHRFMKRYPKHEDTKLLYFRVAEIHQKRREWAKALKLYQRFLRTYKKSAWTIKAHLESALMYEKLGKTRQSDRTLDLTVKLGKRRIEGAPAKELPLLQAWVAQARYLQGEDRFQEYKALKFSLPQKTMAKQIKKKAELLKEVTDTFEDVLTLKSAERSACALWMIGQTYQEFSRALMEAPIPKGLTPDEEQVYKIKLQERAIPVEDKAFAAYAKNLALAAQNNVFNECVRGSGEALSKARPEEYPAVKEDSVRTDHAVESLVPAPMVLQVGPPAAPKVSATRAAGGVSDASR